MKKSIKILSLALSCVATLTLAGSAVGQELTSGNSSLDAKTDSSVTNIFTLTPSYTYLWDTDFKDNNLGKISVQRADMRAGYVMKSDQAEFGVGALYEYTHYDLSKVKSDSGFDDDYNRLAFSAHYKGMVNDNWGYFGFAAAELAAGSSANLGDGLMGTFAGGARYVWSENLSLGFGAALRLTFHTGIP